MENIIYILVIVFLDTFLYGYCYEIKIKKLNTNPGLYSASVFNTIYEFLKVPINWLFDKTIRYRILQKIFEILGLFFVYISTDSFIPVIGLLIAHYFQTFDFLYYVIMNQLDVVETSYQHLLRWYGVGYILWFVNSGIFVPMSFFIFGGLGLIFSLVLAIK